MKATISAIEYLCKVDDSFIKLFIYSVFKNVLKYENLDSLNAYIVHMLV